MKFNGEFWMKIPVTQQAPGEPDEFVLVKNPKFRGGIIPYARYGDEWTANPIPNRVLIRELALALEQEREMFSDIS